MGPPGKTAGVVATGGPDLYAALVAAMGELSDVPKGQTATAGTYSYQYADLATVLTYVRPILAKHGLAVTQPVTALDGSVVVETVILHTSGESLAFGKLSMPRGQTPQQTGSAITYARRYSLLSTLGLATADDDGAAASKYEPPKVEDKPRKVGPGARAGAERIVALLQSTEKVTEDVAKEATREAMKETNRAWADLIRPEYQDQVLDAARNWLTRKAAEEVTGPAAVTEYVPPLPAFYLNQAQAEVRHIRAWIARNPLLKTEPAWPEPHEWDTDRKDFVYRVLDDLDRELVRTIESVEHHLPKRKPQAQSPEASLNIHRLRTLESMAREIGTWAHRVRWSTGASAEDLGRLDAIASNIAENTRHLLAQAEQVELAR